MELNDDILIQNYFDGLLEPSEETALKQRIDEDKLFRKNYMAYEELYQHLAIRKKYRSQFKIVKTIGDEYEEEEKGNHSKMWWLLIPLLLAIAIAAYFFFTLAQTLNHNELFEQHFIAEKISMVEKGDNNQTTIDQALDAYNSNEYQKTIQSLEPIEKLPNEAKLALAISYIEENQTQSARELLLELNEIHIYRNAAKWYLALAHLKDGNLKECKEQLLLITQSSSYQKDAGSLLKVLE